MIDSLPSAIDLNPLAESVAVALVAHQGDRASCEVPRRKIAEELGMTAARVSVGFTELRDAGLLTITWRSGHSSSFSVSPILQRVLAGKAQAHLAAFPIETPRMSAREAVHVAKRAGCRLYLDDRRVACVSVPQSAVPGVIERLRAADVALDLEAWLQEYDLGDAPVVHAAARLLSR